MWATLQAIGGLFVCDRLAHNILASDWLRRPRLPKLGSVKRVFLPCYWPTRIGNFLNIAHPSVVVVVVVVVIKIVVVVVEVVVG